LETDNVKDFLLNACKVLSVPKEEAQKLESTLEKLPNIFGELTQLKSNKTPQHIIDKQTKHNQRRHAEYLEYQRKYRERKRAERKAQYA